MDSVNARYSTDDLREGAETSGWEGSGLGDGRQ